MRFGFVGQSQKVISWGGARRAQRVRSVLGVAVSGLALALGGLLFSNPALAQGTAAKSTTEKKAADAPKAQGEEPLEEEAADEPRKFNDVLMDLLNEFAFDMKSGLLKGVPNTAIRRVALSDGIPKSYETFMESMVSERLRKYSTVKVIQCAQCKTKRSFVEKGRVIVSTPVNNPAELDKISEVLKIETWTDVAVLYQETSLLLAFNVFDAKTKELLWTKIYNSESLYRKVLKERPSAKTALDGESQDGEGEKEEDEPKSKYALSFTAGYILVPNVKTSSNMLGAIVRAAEVFNLERSEIGASVMPVVDPGLFIQNYEGVEGDPSASDEVEVGGKKETIKPFRFGLGLFGSYHHNFVTLPINYDQLRYGAHLSLGGILAKGYITFTGRTGATLKFGRRFVLELGVMYSAPTTLTIQDEFTYKTQGGIGADITFGLSF